MSKEIIISGIQQLGVGVSDLNTAWKWYRDHFNYDVSVFVDDEPAKLMLPYTDGKPREKVAALTLNMQGGGGFEIWQHTGRTPLLPKQELQLGDLGIFAGILKCKNALATYKELKEKNVEILSHVFKNPDGTHQFFIKDPFGNVFSLVESTNWFQDKKKQIGGVYGAIIGVTDIQKSKKLYADILGYDIVVFEQEGVIGGYDGVPGGKSSFKRVVLKHSKPREGSFSQIFGASILELIQVQDRKPFQIYEGRLWGDPGFIHLCFDIHGMDTLRELCKEKGQPFTVDSAPSHDGASFDMGDAAGYFSYIEDYDGTLIEFVETHKLPISKKLGIAINLQKRDPRKSLPRLFLKALGLNKAKLK